MLEALARAEEALRDARGEVQRAPGARTLDDLVERLHIDEAAVVAFVETLAELPRRSSAQRARRAPSRAARCRRSGLGERAWSAC